MNEEENAFLEDLENDEEMRSKINIYRDKSIKDKKTDKNSEKNEEEEEEGEFAPEIDEKEWRLVINDPHKASGKNEYDFTFKVFERITTIENADE